MIPRWLVALVAESHRLVDPRLALLTVQLHSVGIDLTGKA